MKLADATLRALREHWNSSRSYRSVASNCRHLERHLGEISLSKITEKTLQELVNRFRKEGNGATTINRKLSTLQTILRLAQEDWGEVITMPRFNKYRTAEKPTRFHVLSEDEENQIVSELRSLGEDEMADLVVILVDTGMRLSEALRLVRKDVDFDHNLIMIWESKNDRPRSVPMTKRVVQILKHRNKFTLSDNRVKYLFRKTRPAIEVTIHTLRHTCASRLVQKGVSLYVVQRWLGHSTIHVTERYAHLNPAQLQDAVSLLERAESIPPSYSV